MSSLQTVASGADMVAERVYFLYGSETGNSESIAKRLHHEAVRTHGFADAECLKLNDVVSKKLLDPQLTEDGTVSLCLVIVCSTTGEGEPPDNAMRFRRWLRNNKGTLHRVRYTVLALGDTNYNNFCAAGAFIDAKLTEFGAKRFFARGEADDGIGIDLVVDPWIRHVWAALLLGSVAPAVGPVCFSSTTPTPEQAEEACTPHEVAIVYSNASQICSTLSLFLYERLVELGGCAELFPVQYFATSAAILEKRSPQLLVLILCTDSDEHTLCAECARSPMRQPPLGPFAQLFDPQTSLSDPALSETSLALRDWMANEEILRYAAVCVTPRNGSAPRATALDAKVKEVAAFCRLQCVCDKQITGEVRTIAVCADDVYEWSESVISSVPGITSDINEIHTSIDWFFSDRVGGAFRDAHIADAPPVMEAPHNAGLNGARHNNRSSIASLEGGTHTNLSSRRRHKHSHTDGDCASTSPSTLQDNTVQIVGHLLTPLVFQYTGNSIFISSIAREMYDSASLHHLRASISDLSNFRHTGFPRHATFIFVVAGTLTKSMNKVLRALRLMSSDTSLSFEGVKFAILGIDDSSGEKFNVCALELETVLLSLRATKIHCTGLANIDRPSELRAVVSAWEANLWSAIMNPTTSMAYLDSASPNVAVGHTYPSNSMDHALTVKAMTYAPTCLGGPPTSAAAVGAVTTSGEHRPPHHQHHRGGNADVTKKPAETGAVLPTSKVASPNGDKAPAAAETATPASYDGAFPWDAVPLNRGNAAHTPITLLYSSSGMSKTMATHALAEAKELGFTNVQMHSFSNFHHADFTSFPNVILFCECGADGQSTGGRQLKKYLLSPLHLPDHLSHVRFGVLGLGAAPPGAVHPALTWASMLSRLQGTRVFPVVVMGTMSQVHSLGMPWCECVLASMAVASPIPSHSALRAAAEFDQAEVGSESGRAGASLTQQALLQRGMLSPRSRQLSVLFLFGSSTGMTETIARELHREALEKGYYSRIAALKYFEKMNFLSTEVVAIVCSTANAHPGGFPDNARKFARYMHRRDQPPNLLCSTNYAVLGVDNGTLYPNSFCHAATSLDARLEALGGTRLCQMGRVDTSCSIVHPVEEWRQAFFGAVASWSESDATQDNSGHLLPVPMDAQRQSTPLPRQQSPRPSSAGLVQQERRLLLAFAAPPDSAVPGIVTHLQQVIAGETPFVSEACTMNTLTQTNWRPRFTAVVFVVSCSDDEDYSTDGGAFLRLLRQRTNPTDMFNGVHYGVLAVTASSAGRFFLGRLLDRRLEELGGTRFLARGEAVDSVVLDRTVERWTTGLLSSLEALSEQLHDERDASYSNSKSPHHSAAVASGAGAQPGGRRVTALEALAETAGPQITSSNMGVATVAEVISQTSTVLTAMTQQALGAASRDYIDAVLHSWKWLTAESAECGVLHMNFSVPNNTHWTPGQTVSILPTNEGVLVDRILKWFKLRHAEPFHPLSLVDENLSSYQSSPLYAKAEFPLSCGTVLQRYVSLRLAPSGTATTAFFAVLRAAASTEAEEEAVASALNFVSMQPHPSEVAGILDILPAKFPLSFRHLVENLSLLQPRSYSIASSCLAEPGTLSLCVRVVPHGLCTGWLRSLCLWSDPSIENSGRTPKAGELVVVVDRRRQHVIVPMVVRAATEFRMPLDSLIPLVLVGPGTGIAPFRAFLQQREAMRRRARTVAEEARDSSEPDSLRQSGFGSIEVYFGCRRSSVDFLYAEELQAFERSGALTSLNVAFSREPSGGAFWYGGCYVQDQMAQNGVALCEALFRDGARLFVCGDADTMTKEVHQTLLTLVQQYLRVGDVGARDAVERLMREGAYVRDVWTS